MSAPRGERERTGVPASRPPVLPLVLLGLMTLATFAGPFVIGVVLRGGESKGWPPDRPVEWLTFFGITGAVVALLAACLTVGLWSLPRPRPPGPGPG
jgi:hypothetical protein